MLYSIDITYTKHPNFASASCALRMIRFIKFCFHNETVKNSLNYINYIKYSNIFNRPIGSNTPCLKFVNRSLFDLPLPFYNGKNGQVWIQVDAFSFLVKMDKCKNNLMFFHSWQKGTSQRTIWCLFIPVNKCKDKMMPFYSWRKWISVKTSWCF